MKKLIICAAVLIGVSDAPAIAQVCSTTSVNTALGSLTNKIPGPPSAQSTALLRYSFGNDVTSDCDLDTSNGGVSMSVTQVLIWPSCNLSAGACTNDPGAGDGDPSTPAIEFFSLDATTCVGGLASITVDTTDPFAVAVNFAVPLTFPPNTGCSVDFTLHVRELGNATTPNTIAQKYTTNAECGCEPGLIAASTTSTQISLTCPPCSTNFCAPQHCDATTFQCVDDGAPDCTNPDNDLCTPGSCDPTASDGNGACVSGNRRTCGNENSFCNPGHCAATTGACVLDTPPNCSNPENDHCRLGLCNEQLRRCDSGAPIDCDDHNSCTDDSCNPSTGCVRAEHAGPCDDGTACTIGDDCQAGVCVGTAISCDDGNVCTDDSCDPSTGCVHMNNAASCDDGNTCTTDDTCAEGECLGAIVSDDSDGDGVCDALDCAPSDATVYAGAAEINDGTDNQCPGDPGYGVIDEISGMSGFTSPGDSTRFAWIAQDGATSYDVVRSTTSDFSSGCVLYSPPQPFIVDSETPTPGDGFYYLVRPLAPHAGGWGQLGNGTPRMVPCVP